jgi:hypothetical protein
MASTMGEMDDLNRSERDLTAGERDVLTEDRRRWEQHGSGSHLDEWLAYGPGLLLRRRLAMRLAYTTRPEGRGYVQAFARIMVRDGLYTEGINDPEKQRAEKTQRKIWSDIIWLHEDGERLNVLREIRDSMSPRQRAQLNSPISARQQVEKLLDARIAGPNAEAKVRTSPVALLKDQLADAKKEIAQLKAKIERLESRADHANVYFDLRKDDARQIGETMTSHMEESKFDRIVKAAKESFKAKRYKQHT